MHIQIYVCVCVYRPIVCTYINFVTDLFDKFYILKKFFPQIKYNSQSLLFFLSLDSLAVLEVSRMQAALYRLPPAGFNAPHHHVPHTVAVRRPPSVPQSTPRGPFLAPGHRPTEGARRKRAGEMEGMREKGGQRQTLGQKKRLQVWINHNHLSHESVACVTSQRLHTQVTLSNTKCSSSSRGHNRAQFYQVV